MSSDNKTNPANPANWPHRYLRGLQVSVSGNAQAFGFSILITISYGIVSASSSTPSTAELVGFTLSAVAAFSMLNLLVAWLTRNKAAVDSEPTRVVLIATATDFLAVGAGFAAAYGATAAVSGWGAWVLAPFAASLTYGLVQALELAFGRSNV